jgi:hypothetical protein
LSDRFGSGWIISRDVVLGLNQIRQRGMRPAELQALTPPPGKGVAYLFVGGKGSSVCRCNTQLYRFAKPGFLNDVIPGSIRRQLVGQSMDFLAYCLTGFAHGMLPFRKICFYNSPSVVQLSTIIERTAEYGKLRKSALLPFA